MSIVNALVCCVLEHYPHRPPLCFIAMSADVRRLAMRASCGACNTDLPRMQDIYTGDIGSELEPQQERENAAFLREENNVCLEEGDDSKREKSMKRNRKSIFSNTLSDLEISFFTKECFKIAHTGPGICVGNVVVAGISYDFRERFLRHKNSSLRRESELNICVCSYENKKHPHIDLSLSLSSWWWGTQRSVLPSYEEKESVAVVIFAFYSGLTPFAESIERCGKENREAIRDVRFRRVFCVSKYESDTFYSEKISNPVSLIDISALQKLILLLPNLRSFVVLSDDYSPETSVSKWQRQKILTQPFNLYSLNIEMQHLKTTYESLSCSLANSNEGFGASNSKHQDGSGCLRTLSLPNCGLDGCNLIFTALSLQFLDLSQSKYLTDENVLHLKHFTCLKVLLLRCCRLVCLSPGPLVACLPALQYLSLDSTSVNDETVRQIGDGSRSLVYLSLNFCPYVTDVNPLVSIPTLKKLCALYCSFGIDGTRAWGQNDLRQANIQSVVVGSHTQNEWDPNSFAKVPSVAKFALRDINNSFFFQIPSRNSLRELHITMSRNLTSLDGIEHFSHLTHLQCEYTSITKEGLRSLARLRESVLRSISFQSCSRLHDLEPLTKLSKLEALDLGNTSINDDGLRSIVALRNTLRKLNLEDCAHLSQVGCLGEMSVLEELNLSSTQIRSDSIALLSANINLTNSSRLRKLDLSYCAEVTDVGFLGSVKSLTWLDISFSGANDAGIEGLASSVSLCHILLNGCDMIQRDCTYLLSIPTLIFLSFCSTEAKSLAATQNTSFNTPSPALAASLRFLNVSGCHYLTDVACLRSFQRLQYLDISTTGVTSDSLQKWVDPVVPATTDSIVPLEKTDGVLGSLVYLSAKYCLGITHLNVLKFAPCLRVLKLSCSNVQQPGVQELAFCPNLEVLEIENCKGIFDISCLATSKSLRVVRAGGSNVRCAGAEGFEGNISMRELDLCGCMNLTSFLGFSKLRNLEILSLSNCQNICNENFQECFQRPSADNVVPLDERETRPFSNFPSLVFLDISYNRQLTLPLSFYFDSFFSLQKVQLKLD